LTICVVLYSSSSTSFSANARIVVYSEPTCLAKDSSSLYRLFGTKTTYTSALDAMEKIHVTVPDSCHPIMFYLFKRHGIRFLGGKEDIVAMDKRLSRLRQEVLEAADQGKTGLCPEDIAQLWKWKWNVKEEDDNLLTDTGVQETQQIGMSSTLTGTSL
jgi:hypothetical protein